MSSRKLPADFKYLEEMYADEYFPDPLVDKLRDLIKEVVAFLESGPHTNEEIQASLDQMTTGINDLQEEFFESGSEIETVARESIATTIMDILKYFEVNIDIEEAIRHRDW
jgi:hypothetical protein